MSRRSLESRLDDLEGQTENSGLTVAYRDPETDELKDKNGQPIDQDTVEGELIVIKRSLVMPREQAECENREILGPAENATGDCVKVPIRSDTVPYQN